MLVTAKPTVSAHVSNADHLVATKGGVYIPAALAGNVTLDDTYPRVCKFDTGGSHRDVTLDPVATAAGVTRRIVNAASGATNLVLKNVGGDTIATVNQNEQGEVYCDGATWSLIAITTIALS
jgi:hypothetical protein